jgi:hypothetical protein
MLLQVPCAEAGYDIAFAETVRRYGICPLWGRRSVGPLLADSARLVVAMRYDKQIMFIRFIGTHAEYDRVDATTV